MPDKMFARVVKVNGNHTITFPGGKVRSFERARGWYAVTPEEAEHLAMIPAYQRLDPQRGDGPAPESAEPPAMFEIRSEAQAKQIQEAERRKANPAPVEEPLTAAEQEAEESPAPIKPAPSGKERIAKAMEARRKALAARKAAEAAERG